nr:neurotensin/neuromedin N-like [Salvelinus alpinus]
MQAQLAFVLLLCLTCGILCSGSRPTHRGPHRQRQGLHTIQYHTLKLDYDTAGLELDKSKQNAPYWHVSLVNVCRMVNSLINSRLWREQEEYNTGDELGERLASLLEPLDKLLDLQHICRVLQPRELLDNSQEYLDADQNSDNPLKRKSPYIFRRQVKNTKARRPYILKRGTFY